VILTNMTNECQSTKCTVKSLEMSASGKGV
jgi:hypothetical protein